jgi:asparagine synthase (glutamine-hydrolysing)
MCGIAGFYDLKLNTGESNRLECCLQEAIERLRHRGPDGDGLWVDKNCGVGLGHRRLAIIDPSPQGSQPMTSACGRYVVTFNGEIYNFLELRRQLEVTGQSFRTRSDTEVLVEAISRWSVIPALKRFTGMYAFGVWDRKERALTLVRDRLGEKPLYYAVYDGVLLFASELRALICWWGCNADIDRGALCLLLRLGYIPAPRTILQGVFKLPPGCSLTVTGQDGVRLAQPMPYWSLSEKISQGAEKPFAGCAAEAAERIEELLLASIRRQLIADVPVGAFLSGGIDSSCIAALACEVSGKLRTFTVGQTSARYDESAWAGAVAQHLGTEHTELRFSTAQLAETIIELARRLDEPFADSSQVPTYLLASLARHQVKVCLSGDGADEMFGGYWHYVEVPALWRRLRRLPQPLRLALARLVGAVHGSWPKPALLAFEPLRRYLGIGGDRRDALYRAAWALSVARPLEVYLSQVSEWQSPDRVVLGAQEPTIELTEPGPLSLTPAQLLGHMMRLDGCIYLPEDILTKVDRASMAVALEVRAPYLDHQLVEFVCSLPYAIRICRGKTKWPLRRILLQRVPPRLTERPKKGFGIPVDELLRGSLREWVEAQLDASRLRREGIFDPAPIRSRWRDHLEMEGCNWGGPLWSVLMFQAWYEAYRSS